MLSSRFLLSLAVALSLSTLALANSATVNLTTLHSGSSVSSHSSITGGNAMPLMFNVSNSRTSTGLSSNARGSGLLLGTSSLSQSFAGYYKGTPLTFAGAKHGNISYKDGNFAVWNRGGTPALSTPEPGSLLMLSTGLIGVAGMFRRNLLARLNRV